LRHSQGIENALQQLLGCDFFRFRLVGDDHAMSQHVVTNRLYILRRYVTPTVEKRLGLGRARQENRGPPAGAVLDIRDDVQPNLGWSASSVGDVDDVALDLVVDVSLVDGIPQLEDLWRSQYRFDGQVRLNHRHAIEDLQLLILVRIVQLQLEHEAIYLR